MTTVKTTALLSQGMFDAKSNRRYCEVWLVSHTADGRLETVILAECDTQAEAEDVIRFFNAFVDVVTRPAEPA